MSRVRLSVSKLFSLIIVVQKSIIGVGNVMSRKGIYEEFFLGSFLYLRNESGSSHRDSREWLEFC